jgi:nicastrin
MTGLIVLLGNATNDNQLTSPDSSCPNCQFGLYANDKDQYQWNTQAQNLIEESFGFPIFAIRPEDNFSRSVYDSVIAVKRNKETIKDMN